MYFNISIEPFALLIIKSNKSIPFVNLFKTLLLPVRTYGIINKLHEPLNYITAANTHSNSIYLMQMQIIY